MGGGVTHVLPSVPQIFPTGQHVVPQVFWAPAQERRAEQAEKKCAPNACDTLCGLLRIFYSQHRYRMDAASRCTQTSCNATM